MDPEAAAGVDFVMGPEMGLGVDSQNRPMADFADIADALGPDMDPCWAFALAVYYIAATAEQIPVDTLDVEAQAEVPDLRNTADFGRDLAGADNFDREIPDLGLGFDYPFFVFYFLLAHLLRTGKAGFILLQCVQYSYFASCY